MELEKFDTIFHVALGLNFAYAIESFSKRINLFFSQPARVLGLFFSSKFSSSIVGITLTKKDSPEINLGMGVDHFQRFYTKNFSWITELTTPDSNEEAAEKKFNFDSKFQSIYLACGVLSLAMIILIPFSEEMEPHRLMTALFTVDFIVLLLIFYCFVTSFATSMPKVPNSVMFLILAGLIFLFFEVYFNVKPCNVYEFMKDEKCVIPFTVTLSLLVFILHILRVGCLLLSMCGIVIWGMVRYGKINKRFNNIAKSQLDFGELKENIEITEP
jgi:hypothetical protein